MRICPLSASSPMMRSATTLALADMCPILMVDIDEGGMSMRLFDGFEETLSRRVPLAHSCMTCSLREGITPLLEELGESDIPTLLLALPIGAELMSTVPALVNLTLPDGPLVGMTVTSAVHITDADCAARDMFEHVPLVDVGCALFDNDDRCTGEILMNSVEYADIVCALGCDTVGTELIERLRPLDTLMVAHLDQLTSEILFSAGHDPEAAIERIHPASTQAWGGPSTHGVWTLDLHSDKPFHPHRLARHAHELAPQGICARGCFWVPSRPTMVGTWEVSSGGASIGRAGEWEDGAFTHLIVTGVGSDEDRKEIAEAFGRLLMTDSEMADALAWIGAADGLDDWFGED
ncbi:GTP-binding protein [Actinomyces mediterranea]|uniref:GTP-binding protein n=1 Tax=Actinomyces mediterranea TaxID=1871028 RepID=UPI0009FA6E8A|nr:GTP-binding protein [Actinomyces mediterranea]